MDYVAQDIVNPEGFLNRIIGSKVTLVLRDVGGDGDDDENKKYFFLFSCQRYYLHTLGG